jgi:hypothetical protein
MPICGDQGDGTAQLKCPTPTPLHDIQMFRVPGTGPVDLPVDFVFAEANLPNELLFFRVDDARGTIGTLSPAETGYLEAAFDRAEIIFAKGSTPATPDATLHVTGGDLIAFFIVQGDSLASMRATNPTNDLKKTPLAFFSITALNPDPATQFGGDHFVGFDDVSGNFTQFGFEDKSATSDWDYDDVVYNVGARLERPVCGGPDTDGDGVADECDTCPNAADPDQQDRDGDLIGDACDNCPRAPNFSQVDTDGDGHGDECSLEICNDGKDNDGDGLVDDADDDCPAIHLTKIKYPRTGINIGDPAKIRGTALQGPQGTVIVGHTDATVQSWKKSITITVPPIPAGVYPVRVQRGDQQSDQRGLFVRSLDPPAKTAMMSTLDGVLGDTTWWHYYSSVRKGKSAANPVQVYDSIVGVDPPVDTFVHDAVAAIDATSFNGKRTAKAVSKCAGYLEQVTDERMKTFIACTDYPGPVERFRALPTEIQLAILNGGNAARVDTCFPASAQYQACRDSLDGGGASAAALATLGF